MMSNQLKWVAALLGAIFALSLGGCIMQRTVKEDGVTVEKGLVVKAPFVD